jgi:nuclear protein localization family protein 4
MPGDIAVRLATAAGRSRIVLPATATLGELQEEVKKRTGVEPLAQKFALDPKGQKAVGGSPGTPLSQLGIVNGAQLHLVNQDADIAAQVLTKQPVPVEPEAQISKSGDTGAAASSSTAAASAPGGSSSSGGGPPKTPQATTGDGKKADPKFETFDSFLRNRRFDTAALPGSQKYVSSRLTDKGMIKIPPSVSIKQQPYRHVDTLSVINVPEMEHFIGYWQNHLLENAMQRVGWMYGYYLEDKNYDEGCRAVIEGIYEPPQEVAGEMAVPKDDPNRTRVDKIAEALGLECIGWIFTTLPLDDGLILSPTEVMRIARLQNEYSTDIHFTRYRLSKFVSCAVRPDASMNGLPSLFPYMVSEQVCAMVRDGILSESGDRTHCVVRDGEKGELISDFIVEGKANKRIATDFFIVRVNDTAPKKHQRMFTHAEFPRENRHTHPQRRADLKKYFRNINNSEPSWSRFADFHLLLYIAQEIDLDSALTISECIRDRKEVPEGILMIINQLVQ